MFEILHQDIEPICVPLEGSEEEPGLSKIYINKHVLAENGGQFVTTMRNSPDAKTLYQLLRASATKWPEQECVGERQVLPDGKAGPYSFISYAQFHQQVQNFAKGLMELGLKPGDKIGIYSSNCIWWTTILFASSLSGLTIVPVYDSLGPGAAEYILNHAEVKVLFVSKFKCPTALTLLDKSEFLTHLVLMSDQDPEGSNDKIQFTNCKAVLEKGENSNATTEPSTPDHVAVIMYTSGSTGTPKGCLLTEGNVLAGAAGFEGLGVSATRTDTYISFLPLAHIYALVVELIVFGQGCRIAYARGPASQFVEDINAIHPTIVVAVPRVLNKVYDSMMAKIKEKPAFIQKLLMMAIKLKSSQVWSNRPSSLLLDNLLLNNFRNALGGRLRLIVNGGAPIMKNVFEFISAAITPNIIQGYGLTETSAGVAVQEAPAKDPTTVGPCGYSCQVRFRAVENTNYDAKGEFPCGELLVKGPIVFQGYYKRDDLTSEVLQDGWFATGDVCQLTENRELKIIDRAKQLVKLSQGEYISLTNLSEQYGRSEGVSFIYVYANSQHDKPVALVVPERSMIKKWNEQGIKTEDIPTNKQVKDELLASLKASFEQHKMRGFERLQNILIDTEEPTVENGLLTPSMKPQFNSIKKKYETQLLALYE